MLIPYAIETLEQEKPTANYIIIGICMVLFLGGALGVLSDSALDALVLKGFRPVGLIGHMFLHAGLIHLLGNMLFLWVFGNAICANTGNFVYLLLYLGLGICAGLAHLLFNGGPVIGASGAISGITGVVLAMYPLKHVHLLWIVLIPGFSGGRRPIEVQAWVIIIVWVLFDILWLVVGEGMVGYWSHLGGFVAGVAVGLACLQAGWIQVTVYDNKTLLDIIKGVGRDGHTASLSPRRRFSANPAKQPTDTGRFRRTTKGK